MIQEVHADGVDIALSLDPADLPLIETLGMLTLAENVAIRMYYNEDPTLEPWDET